MKRIGLGMVLASMVAAAAIVVAQGTGQTGQTERSAPASIGSAPTASGHPVAVLDVVRVFNECAQIQDLNELIKQKTEDVTKEANKRREVIDGKQIELGAFQPGKPDYEARRKELVRLNVEANVWFKMTEEEMNREKFDWTRVIYEQATAVAAEVAKERGYDVVIQRTEFKPVDIEQTVQTLRRMIQERAVIYNVPEIDITDVVIRRLDAAYKAAGGKKQLEAKAPVAPEAANPGQ